MLKERIARSVSLYQNGLGPIEEEGGRRRSVLYYYIYLLTILVVNDVPIMCLDGGIIVYIWVSVEQC